MRACANASSIGNRSDRNDDTTLPPSSRDGMHASKKRTTGDMREVSGHASPAFFRCFGCLFMVLARSCSIYCRSSCTIRYRSRPPDDDDDPEHNILLLSLWHLSSESIALTSYHTYDTLRQTPTFVTESACRVSYVCSIYFDCCCCALSAAWVRTVHTITAGCEPDGKGYIH